MAHNRSQSLRSMTLTALRREAASRGIKGLSKSPREEVYAAIRSHCRPLHNAIRQAHYHSQNGYGDTFRATPRQSRRMVHKANRMKDGK